MLKAVLFDAYGTLLDTGRGSVEAAGRILERSGREDITPAGFYARWKQLHACHMGTVRPFVNEEGIYRLDLRALYREYGIRGDPDRDVGLMLSVLGTRVPYPETEGVLRRLAGQAEVCIASVTDTGPLQRDLERGGLYVRKVFTSESLRCYKPDPAFYTAVLGELGIRPEQALFVGDSLVNDVLGPQRVGIPACWVNRKGERAGDAQPEYTITGLDGLCPIVDSLLGGKA